MERKARDRDKAIMKCPSQLIESFGRGLTQEWLTARGYFANDWTTVDAAQVECEPDTFVRRNMEMGTVFGKNIYIYIHTHTA